MTLVAVLIGGLLGTGLRLGISAVFLPDAAFPWSTLVINVVGSFALAFLVARVWPTAPAWLRAGLGTGVLGSFTTFSALVVSLLTLTQDGMAALAALYLLMSLLVGLAAALLGLRLGSRLGSRLGVSHDSAAAGGRVSTLVIVVALAAGAVGAGLRYAASTLIGRTRANLPWAVLLVNAVGSLVGGIVLGLAQSGAIGADARLVVLGGFAGGLTTFSTFSVETVQLALAGRWRTALGSVLANLVVGIALAVAGFALTGGFS